MKTQSETFAADGKTPVLSAPGMPLMVSAAEFNRVLAERDALAVKFDATNTTLLEHLESILEAKAEMVAIGVEQDAFPAMFQKLLAMSKTQRSSPVPASP